MLDDLIGTQLLKCLMGEQTEIFTIRERSFVVHNKFPLSKPTL